MKIAVTTSRTGDQRRHQELGAQQVRPGQDRLVGPLVDADHRLLLDVGEQPEALGAGHARRAGQLRAGAALDDRRAIRRLGRRVLVGGGVRSLLDRHRLILSYTGPQMPPSFRILQKWTTMRMAVMSGKAMTCIT